MLSLLLLGPPSAWADFSEALATPEFQVNTHTPNDQRIPEVTADAAGNSLIVWQSRNQNDPGWGIHGQRLDARGNLVGGEFRINEFNIGNQEGQRPGMLPNGEFTVVWHGPDRASDRAVIQQRRFDANGLALSADLRVSEVVDNLQMLPRMDLAADGRMVVAWDGRGVTNTTFNVFSRAFEPPAAPLTPVVQVNQFDETAQRRVDVAIQSGTANGHHVVAWQSAIQDGSDWGVFARCLTLIDQSGEEFLVNQTTIGAQARPRIAMADDGSFAITWQDNRGRSSFEYQRVMVRLFDAGCLPTTPELQVNQADVGIQDLPHISLDGAGVYVLVWHSFPPDFAEQGIRGRRLAANGQFLGSEFRVSQEVEAFQDFPTVQGLPDGGFVATWETAGQDGSGFGIFARRFFGPATAALELIAGDGQTARVGEVFDLPVQVRVTDQWGVPKSGQRVVFSAALEGASAEFENGAAQFEAITDDHGRAQAIVIAGEIAGPHDLLVEVAGLENLALLVRLINLAVDSEPIAVPGLDWRGWVLLALLLATSAWLRTLLSFKGWSHGR